MGDIIRREAERTAICRGCDFNIMKGTEMIYTYSIRGQGQSIYFCLSCAKKNWELGN